MLEPSGTLVSIQVGRPRTYGLPKASDPLDKTWRSAIFKEPVASPVVATHLGLAGDDQAERKVHGGPDKALLAYAASHYPRWREELGKLDMQFGGFGENLTIEGLDEESVCLGDVYTIGLVRVEVSQPRQPCWKLARRWRMTDLPDRVLKNGRSGWYLRVLSEGVMERGQKVELVERPYPQWSVARASQVMHFSRQDQDAMQALAACPPLSESWRETLEKRLAKLR